jgi:hypothetical protein
VAGDEVGAAPFVFEGAVFDFGVAGSDCPEGSSTEPTAISSPSTLVVKLSADRHRRNGVLMGCARNWFTKNRTLKNEGCGTSKMTCRSASNRTVPAC